MEQRDTEQKNTNFTDSSNGQSYTGQAENAFYQKHHSMSVIVKKTEKITTAIYMVTDFMPDSEPLRSRLRTLSLSLITGTRRIGSRSSEPHYALTDEVSRTIDETASLIMLASTIGLISDMNGQILRTELEKVDREMRSLYDDKKVLVTTHPGYANILLNPAMFEVAPSETTLPVFNKGQVSDKGQTINQNVQHQKEQVRNITNENSVKKSDIGIKIARKNDVLNIVRNKGKVSIKDITSILKDMSEKTVQRELHALVSEGVLIKEGEKRWSTYRINK